MKFNLDNFIRPNLLQLRPYSSLREEMKTKNLIFLEANENPFGRVPRYPNSQASALRAKIAEINSINEAQIFAGNGSDELIDLIIRAFCEPRKDSIIVMEPSFVMYEFYAQINDITVEKLHLDHDFNLNITEFDKLVANSRAKVLFLCSPNNPTGNSIKNLEYFIEKFSGIVVVDEAYIEFSSEKSALQLLKKYPNLIVLKTLSKAYGLAGLRLGFGFSSVEIASFMMKIKPPYNISSESQKIACEVLENPKIIKENINTVLKEKERLNLELAQSRVVKKIFPSDANFYLVKVEDAEKVYQNLIKNKILTSLRHPKLDNCLRLSIGTVQENNKLLTILKKL